MRISSSPTSGRGALASALAFPALLAMGVTARAETAPPLPVPPTPVETIEPHVPIAAGQPCIVQLIRNRLFPQQDLGAGPPIDASFTFMPPPACPRPWSKVILKVDITSMRWAIVDTLGLNLGGITLFRGGQPRYRGVWRWHVERDLTDYSALFGSPHNGRMWTITNEDARDYSSRDLAFAGTATLAFYPATARTPAPRVPDAVVPINGQTARYLPHNIVRAYLDVNNEQPWWFTCVPDRLAERFPLYDMYAPGEKPHEGFSPAIQGCGGTSFREMAVAVDGTPAGIAPVFPRISPDVSEFLRNSINAPAPSMQQLDFVPYRVDLTPFAAILNEAGPHHVSTPGALLLYLDRGRAHVTGAVTTNTLIGAAGLPRWTSTLSRTDETTRGKIVTHQGRDFEIRGFVNTSRGRVETRLTQSSRFANTQTFHVEGPLEITMPGGVDKLYEQGIDMSSTTERTVRRWIGSRLVSRDHVSLSYPLQLGYRLAGTLTPEEDWSSVIKDGTVAARQHLLQDTDAYKAGLGHYVTHLRRNFVGSRTRTLDRPDSDWSSVASHQYTDNFGSCYRADITTLNGGVQSFTHGTGCPGNSNYVRWFAHPDGSANSLGWWH
ncbi:peptide-N4-asparagine amidase [Frateuria soli]|uniref:peptide-N4-asparagine amidase n=1 Tax=Frateuria soli TaxID=1542730 RepID=UPI001E2DA558|nr:peptide-N4-asparagine amidase [Frateuria soli]UGB36856.1 hypothetical protein LQ771_08355 [Frateuria soli]